MTAQVQPELVDRLIELYCDWRTACSEVRAGYELFVAAPAEERDLAYAVYGAALDREQAVADEYARALMRIVNVAPAFAPASVV